MSSGVAALIELNTQPRMSLSVLFFLIASMLPSDVEAEMPDSELFAKVFACHNADGGFAWFEGMKSSPVITATLLERFSKMISAGYLDASAPVSADAALCADVDAVLRSAVRYLDKSHFSTPALCP